MFVETALQCTLVSIEWPPVHRVQEFEYYAWTSILLSYPVAQNSGEVGAHVTQLAEWSCGQVREAIKHRGEREKWVASYDGFYLTRGHYSNNSSATLHDFTSGRIAWFTHRTKRGPGHNWSGTSGGAEGDMLEEIHGKVRAEGFVVSEIVTDKDSSMNAIYCRHFPEGTITYCSNHCSKTLHKDLLKIKQAKCGVSRPVKVHY